MSYHVNPVGRNFPRLGARSVGALGEDSLHDRLMRLVAAGAATKDQVDYYEGCLADKLGDGTSPGCEADSKDLAKLTPDGMSFYKSCLSQKASDVPVRTQHGACFTEALKVPASAGPAPGGGGGAMVPSDSGGGMAPTQAGMSPGLKWGLIGGGVLAVIAIGFLAMKK